MKGWAFCVQSFLVVDVSHQAIQTTGQIVYVLQGMRSWSEDQMGPTWTQSDAFVVRMAFSQDVP